MNDRLVTIEGTPQPPMGRDEVLRIALSMTAACVLGGAVLAAVFVGTDRYQRAAELRTEREAIATLLDLDDRADVIEVRQSLSADLARVVYDARPFGDPTAPPRRIVFTRGGERVGEGSSAGGADPAGVAGTAPGVTSGGPVNAGAIPAPTAERLTPLGRLFVARRAGVLAGFVVEGTARGYKNRIRFLVALDGAFTIAGVRVLEHEEDPGLGAEIATPAFRGQFIARRATDLAALDVTRDPLPEDWAVVLAELSRTPAAAWRAQHAALIERERDQPVHAITGATISSRALTDGVRATVDHFRRRWALLEPELGVGAAAPAPGRVIRSPDSGGTP